MDTTTPAVAEQAGAKRLRGSDVHEGLPADGSQVQRRVCLPTSGHMRLLNALSGSCGCRNDQPRGRGSSRQMGIAQRHMSTASRVALWRKI